MLRRYGLFAVIAALFIGMANATYLNVQGPVSNTLYNGGAIYLGKVAPGESFYILAGSGTTNATGTYVYPGWDRLEAISYPAGWSSQQSPLYENPMKLKVTTSPNATNGIYNLTIRAVNIGNYSRLGNLTFTAYVNVTPDVSGITVSPAQVSAGPGQPTDIYISINNTGISDDPFTINAVGLPAWHVSDVVVAQHATTTNFTYPVYENEPGQYSFNLTIASTTSTQVVRSYPVTLNVNSNLLNDYSAIGQGVIISPVILEPAYSFMLLLSYLYKLVAG